MPVAAVSPEGPLSTRVARALGESFTPCGGSRGRRGDAPPLLPSAPKPGPLKRSAHRNLTPTKFTYDDMWTPWASGARLCRKDNVPYFSHFCNRCFCKSLR
jgi:hypothetical protein